MRDGFGRTINYARISITDRCNLRCRYCMPEDGVTKLNHSSILTYEELLRVCGALAELGVSRLRVTGGEPLVRKGAVEFIGKLVALPGVEKVSLTTNGLLLAENARTLAQEGLTGVNVSLDTLDAATYRRITRRDGLEQALAGLEAALAAGLNVKVNCVPMRGVNQGQLAALAALGKEKPIAVRFIEMMPIGLGAETDGLPEEAVRRELEAAFGPLAPAGEPPDGGGPAQYWRLPGFVGAIGFISAVGHCFCPGCNRLRLTADGLLKPCLHSAAGRDLHPALAQPDDEALKREIWAATGEKPERHRFGGEDGPGRPMFQIGG